MKSEIEFKIYFTVYLPFFFNRMILNSRRHIKLFDLFDARFWDWKCVSISDSQKRSSPVQHMDVSSFLPFHVSGELLKQLEAFWASCCNPKNKAATRSNVWICARSFLVSPAVKIEIEKPTSCWESLRQEQPNNSKQHGALAKMGNMQAGGVPPGILPFCWTCKSIAVC